MPVIVMSDTRWKAAVLVGLVLLLLPLAAMNGLFHLDAEPHLCALLAFAFVIHVWIRPGASEIAADFGAAAIFFGLYRWAYGMPHSPNGPFFTALTYGGLLGFGSLAVLAIQAQRTKGEERERRRNTLTAGLIAPVAMILIGYPLQISAMMHPKTYDSLLYSFDLSLGFNPSYLVGRAFARSAPLRIVSAIVYDTLPLAVSFFYPALMVQRKRFRVNVILLFSGALLIGSLLYNLCPATGPRYAFTGTFPDHAPARGEFPVGAQVVAHAPRNAMPSLHVGLALLIFWNAYVWGRKGRILAAVYLLFTFLATLGTGEHYLIDLVVAVPFSLAMQAAFTADRPLGDPSRWRPLSMGSALTAVWLVLLRSVVTLFGQSVLLPWMAIVVTLAGCWWAKRLLDSEPQRDIEPSLRLAGLVAHSAG